MQKKYEDSLVGWFPFLKQWTNSLPGKPGCFYGTGSHDHWSIQGNATAFSALAVMAEKSENNELADAALDQLRFLTVSHKSGDGHCASGEKWGCSWISSLALERAAHGISALRFCLNESDYVALRRVMQSECEYILNSYPVKAGIDNASGCNKPESNLWNASMLSRTSLLFPDLANVPLYREKASELFVNGICVPQDSECEMLFNGKKVKDRYVGANFTENFGLNHHGYLNVGYMVICLSQIAILWFFCKEHGFPFPEEAHHHARELWQLVKNLTFEDGRLWRIGGDTRVRYCYCQDYLVPVWLWAIDRFGDQDARKFEKGWLKIVQKEQACSSDGGFLSNRLAELREISPVYYLRLEGDRACSFSMGAYWRRRFPGIGASADEKSPVIQPQWSDSFHGAYTVRGTNRFVSWVWKSAKLPSGQCVPAGCSDMQEAQWNLGGSVNAPGCRTVSVFKESDGVSFAGGFATCGSFLRRVISDPADSFKAYDLAECKLAFVAFPDDATVVVFQRAVAVTSGYVDEAFGINLHIPNDLYNDCVRKYTIDGAEHHVTGAGSRECTRELRGRKIAVDDVLSIELISGAEALAIHQPGCRNVNVTRTGELLFAEKGGSLYCDVIGIESIKARRFVNKGEQLFSGIAVIQIGKERVSDAELLSEEVLKLSGVDGKIRLIAVNTGEVPKRRNIPEDCRQIAFCGEASEEKLNVLNPGSVFFGEMKA